MTSRDESGMGLRAAEAAIGAAVRAVGPTCDGRDLITGIVALMSSQTGYTPKAADELAMSLVVSAVQLVGARRAGELVTEVAAGGGDRSFS